MKIPSVPSPPHGGPRHEPASRGMPRAPPASVAWNRQPHDRRRQDAAADRDHQELRGATRARRRVVRRAPGPPHRLRRRQRRRQDHDHADHPRCARQGRRHRDARRRRGDGIRSPPLRVHARGARSLPEDEGARADRLPRAAARLLEERMPRPAPPRCSSSSDSASASTTTSRRSRSATSSARRSPPRSCTTPRC